MSRIKKIFKNIIPKAVLNAYHLDLAYLANFYYGKPSEKLIIIGVTGTNGKSTTVNLIGKILEEAGHKVVISSTVNFKVGDKDDLNDLKMTMPGRFFLQKLLARGVKAGCKFAVIESSSEGILQSRHVGIHYDVMVFTNLTPEHIEAHGGFENYKNAKLEYFRHLENLPHKFIKGIKIPKSIMVNIDDQYASEFLNFKVDKKITYGLTENAQVRGSNLNATEQGIQFWVGQTGFSLHLKGIFDVYNTLAAIAVAQDCEIDISVAKQALEKISNIPGRMELIDEGQNFKVLVDYSPEPESLKQMYATVKNWPHNKIIHLLGSTGGGRDVARRKILGNIAGENADIVIVTNEDPYDDDPKEIIHQVADGAVEVGKIIKQNLFRDPDRRNAIAKALSLAQPNDLVILTGKGSEQKMAVKGGYIPWDDRAVAREELQKLKK
ncbi:MAG TPA: UDP-N-acetylmuramyl-tripeptide synthetase [Methylomirabilota bacterium]|nr:UDP-N-acetylmuramyl-tripeptide synthetase [Methylomirabilota bacterium]